MNIHVFAYLGKMLAYTKWKNYGGGGGGLAEMDIMNKSELIYDNSRPKASVSLIVDYSTETTSGSTRPPIIETEVWGPLSVRDCTEQMVRFGRTAMNEICYEIFTLYILIHAAI